MDFITKKNEKMTKIKEEELRAHSFVPTLVTRKDRKENAKPVVMEEMSVADRLFKNASEI